MSQYDTRLLHPELQRIIPFFLYENYRAGRTVRITSCYRTVEEQNALSASVTQCNGSRYESPHQWWIAFDICRMEDLNHDGTITNDEIWNTSDNWWTLCAYTGKSLGLQPGALWTGSWVDLPHYQLGRFFRENYQSVSNSYVKETYQTPDRFHQSWQKQTSLIKENWANLFPTALKQLFSAYMCTTTKAAYLYQKAYTGKYITKVAKGKSVYIIKDNGVGMSQVLLADGSVGYIYNKSLSKSDLSAYRLCTVNHNTYLYPGKNTGKAITVDKTRKQVVKKSNKPYILYSVNGKWARISYQGKDKWILKARISSYTA